MADIDTQMGRIKRAQEKKKSAVAVSYDLEADPAPRVVATGKELIAEQIIKIAEENGIPIHEDANLIQVLEALEVDAVIPMEAYAAVAEILNYIYRLNGKSRDLERAKAMQRHQNAQRQQIEREEQQGTKLDDMNIDL